MSRTIVDQYPEAWASIEQAGFPNLMKMARQFKSAKLMDAALGYQSAAQKWCKGRIPGFDAERRATDYFKNAACANPPASSGGDMLLVVCPDGVSAKAKRLLSVLGCEVEAL